MIQKIFKLSSDTIDKIAAGEVVQNPASVVKELIENSIDSGALNIRIEIVQGGFEKIRIVDDGEGMSEADALLAVERHATSKIANAGDLAQIKTMGFRGEALSSICAVSKFSMLTKHKDAPEEVPAILLDKGELKRGARSPGTTIEVSSLFYNTPARKKFQKSASASFAEVTKVMTKLALSHPQVAFTFIANQQEVFCVRRGSWQERIGALLPSNYIDKACLIEDQNELFSLYGTVGLPSEAKGTRSSQHLFINRRSVFSPYLSACAAEAFATRLQVREHPIFVLYLDINPELIDVNIHPQKSEVKLAREQEIGTLLKRAILRALSSLEQVKLAAPRGLPPPLEPFDFTPLAPTYQKAFVEQTTLFAKEATLKASMSYRHLAFVESSAFNEVFESHSTSAGIIVFNLKEVARRLVFDQIYDRIKGASTTALQTLFFPITIELSYEEATLAREHLPLFEKFGILMREFGPSSFIIESIEPSFREEEIPKMIEEIISVIKGKGKEENKAREIAMIGAKFASFSTDQFSGMIKQLMRSSNPYLSPTGAPTMAHLKEGEFDLLFREFKVERSH